MYPDKKEVVKILLAAAETAAWDSSAEHPEDIAIHMATAMESAHVVIMECYRLWGCSTLDAEKIKAGSVTYGMGGMV